MFYGIIKLAKQSGQSVAELQLHCPTEIDFFVVILKLWHDFLKGIQPLNPNQNLCLGIGHDFRQYFS